MLAYQYIKYLNALLIKYLQTEVMKAQGGKHLNSVSGLVQNKELVVTS